MVKQKITVTQSDEFRVRELKVRDGSKRATLKLFYDMDGYLSIIEKTGTSLELSSLIGMLNQNYLNLANVQTKEGTNILIDKLMQGAYTERRSTLSNNGAVTNWAGYTGVNYRGKYFPRGCRGFIETVDVYCRDKAAAGGTITVYITPLIGMGAIHSATITVAASGLKGWRSATFNKPWMYDSLFIFWVCSVGDIEVAYDGGEPYDWWTSGDSGATWSKDTWRQHIRAVYKAQTIGDVPVSGTINTIEIPSQSNVGNSGLVAVTSAGGETTILEVTGAGSVDFVLIYVEAVAGSEGTVPKIYCDGSAAFDSLSYSVINSFGFGATTPGLSLIQYGVNGNCTILFTKRFCFKRSFKVTGTVLADTQMWVYAIPSLIS